MSSQQDTSDSKQGDNQQLNSLLLDECKVLRQKTEEVHVKLQKRFERAVEN